MTTFDERERSFEKKYEMDQELQFKVQSRANKMLGLWAADLLGKSGPAAEAYAKEVVLSDFEKPGHEDVVAKLVADFTAAGKAVEANAIRAQSERLMAEAKKQIMAEV